MKALAACAPPATSDCTIESFKQAVADLNLPLNGSLKSVEQMKMEYEAKQEGADPDATTDLSAKTTISGFDDKDPTAPAAPIAQQGANDQIRTVAAGLCQSYGIQNCDRFGNSMIATFYQECGGKANCMGHGSSYAGSFALSQSEYQNGIQNYLSNCDQSADACQAVTQNCSGGSDGRGNHICNSAAAIANHARIEGSIQSATDNPYQQAAIHMMYQLMPTQTVRALNSGDPSAIYSVQLNGDALRALCSNKICLAPGAVGADAINQITAKYGTLNRGVQVAMNGTAGPVPYGGATSPFAGMFGGQPTQYGPQYAGSPFALGYGTSYPGPVSTGYPVSTGGQVYTGGQVSTGGQISTQSGGLTDAQRLEQYAGGTSGPGSTGRTVTTPVPPVATLIAQPQTVFKGNPVTVSWSTVGMRADQPCLVLVQSGNTPARLAQGNEGSKTILATPSGTLTFTVQCSAILGGLVTKTVSVIVQ